MFWVTVRALPATLKLELYGVHGVHKTWNAGIWYGNRLTGANRLTSRKANKDTSLRLT
jgi:hypothetical protein